jgi:hypothetical protein
MDLNEFLSKNNFFKVGRFDLNVNRVCFKPDKNSFSTFNNVIYTWVAFKTDYKPLVLYVGKTSFNIIKRLKEHEQGFQGKEKNGSISGAIKKDVIAYLLENNFDVYIFIKETNQISKKLIELLKINIEPLPLPSDIYTHLIEEEIYTQSLSLFNSNKQRLPLNNTRRVNNIQDYIEQYLLKI